MRAARSPFDWIALSLSLSLIIFFFHAHISFSTLRNVHTCARLCAMYIYVYIYTYLFFFHLPVVLSVVPAFDSCSSSRFSFCVDIYPRAYRLPVSNFTTITVAKLAVFVRSRLPPSLPPRLLLFSPFSFHTLHTTSRWRGSRCRARARGCYTLLLLCCCCFVVLLHLPSSMSFCFFIIHR